MKRPSKFAIIIERLLRYASTYGRAFLVWDEPYCQPRALVDEELIEDRELIGTYSGEATAERVLADITAYQHERSIRSHPPRPAQPRVTVRRATA